MTHGWPGSVIELLEVVGPLTDPTAHGGTASDAFHLVLPSLPGYGFSGEPSEIGWDPGRTARAWDELMQRLGYTRYVAQGGDVGASVTDAMARQAPAGLAGIHTNLLVAGLGMTVIRSPPPARTNARPSTHWPRSGHRLRLLPGAGDATADDRLLLARFARRTGRLDPRPRHRQLPEDHQRLRRRAARGHLTRDRIVDNITLYWLTGTGASAARAYWESGRAQAAALVKPPPEASIPASFTVFPDEIFQAPRSWVEEAYPNLTYFHEADRGGHFAAWEEPDIFTQEIRDAFRPLR
jgi:pimeloyl-ACP methyl ester carboxylesterase